MIIEGVRYAAPDCADCNPRRLDYLAWHAMNRILAGQGRRQVYCGKRKAYRPRGSNA